MTFEVSEDDIRDGTLGICLSCGNVQDGCEPDARQYECDECGKRMVFGMEEALFMGRITLKEEE